MSKKGSEAAKIVNMTDPAKVTGTRHETRRKKIKLSGELAELAETLRNPDRGGKSDYDPDSFLIPTRADTMIPASDTDGANAKFVTTVMPGMARLVSIIIQSRDFPYDTAADLLRHALHEQVKRLARFDPQVKSVAGQINVMIGYMQDADLNIRFDKLMDMARNRCVELNTMGEQEELNSELDRMLKAIEGMPKGRWRKRFTERFKKELNGFRKEK